MDALLALFLIFVVALPLSAVLNGWALINLWGWFVTPLFSLPELTMGYAIGLGMVVSFLTYHYDTSSSNNSKESALAIASGALVATVLRPTITVFVGWVVYQIFL
ncbi:MAG: hypothetical protein F6K00_19745 [Leptolyngbya sp. SIOISBB]|nr:hypothetical protein [Leptolyngbya sp. SIOISBB]